MNYFVFSNIAIHSLPNTKPIFLLIRDKIQYIIQLNSIDFYEFIIKKAHIHTLLLEKYICYKYIYIYIGLWYLISSSRCPLSEKNISDIMF